MGDRPTGTDKDGRTMAIVTGRIDLDPDEAAAKTRATAASMGYALAEGPTSHDVLVFRKGMTFFSWGSGLTVKLSPDGEATALTITTRETFAITDWGRGKRAAHRLLASIGATATT
jgi:hypothetical protein